MKSPRFSGPQSTASHLFARTRSFHRPTYKRPGDIDQPTAVSDHFTLPGHSLNNLELIPLELINSNRDAIRKAREAFLIYKGKTLEPSGMNRRDEI